MNGFRGSDESTSRRISDEMKTTKLSRLYTKIFDEIVVTRGWRVFWDTV